MQFTSSEAVIVVSTSIFFAVFTLLLNKFLSKTKEEKDLLLKASKLEAGDPEGRKI